MTISFLVNQSIHKYRTSNTKQSIGFVLQYLFLAKTLRHKLSIGSKSALANPGINKYQVGMKLWYY